VQRVGKIDHLIRWQGWSACTNARAPAAASNRDSDYWDKTQERHAGVALRPRLPRHAGGGAGELRHHGRHGRDRFGNTLYDVWHKPTIKPKMLTQADTKAFIETGTYFDQKFETFEPVNGDLRRER
jgi:hypothetical protein